MTYVWREPSWLPKPSLITILATVKYEIIEDQCKTRLAQELYQNAGVPLGPFGIEQCKHFQGYLTNYQIHIVSKEYGNKIIYVGPEKKKKIYLYMHNNHYDVITRMPGFFSRNCPEVSWLTCQDCHRLFKSQQCFEQHKQARGDGLSVCDSLIRCANCQKTVRCCKQFPEKHRCGLTKCWICGKYVQLEDHRCYI